MPINLASVPPSAELFNEEAEDKAKLFSETQMRDANKPSQIRRFYDELVGWQEQIGDDEAKFKELEAFIKMQNAKVAYAKGRKLVDDQFETWFRECIKSTTSAVALKHFRLHFEAVLGFLKALRRD
jgi:CRISPR-associated protein Csm2